MALFLNSTTLLATRTGTTCARGAAAESASPAAPARPGCRACRCRGRDCSGAAGVRSVASFGKSSSTKLRCRLFGGWPARDWDRSRYRDGRCTRSPTRSPGAPAKFRWPASRNQSGCASSAGCGGNVPSCCIALQSAAIASACSTSSPNVQRCCTSGSANSGASVPVRPKPCAQNHRVAQRPPRRSTSSSARACPPCAT